ncbi:MAG: DUF3429 domain-containing protein [Burkholderiaceae bacterium]|nr:DUF3429 domain-containing protein [Burkholderiaceae bacterium]
MNPPAARYVEPLSDSARWLGQLGLAPFVLGAALVWLGLEPELHGFVTQALSAYAGLIVSFLGGIHWGLGFRMTAPPATLFVWGVVPSLVAWLAVLMPASAGLVVHGAMLVACYLVDRRVYPVHGAAHWLVLRFRLSAVASLSCFLGAAGA